MRVLLAPEVYSRHDRLEYNQMLTDMASWVDAWLELDPNVHIYWMLPEKDDVPYDDEFVNDDSDRVTVFNCRRFFQGTTSKKVVSYSEDELEQIKAEKKQNYGYFDIVVPQHAGSMDLLWRFLHDTYKDAYASTAPFKMLRHLYMFKSQWKKHTRYRNNSETMIDLAGLVYADGIWLKHEMDREEVKKNAKQYLSFDAIKNIDGRTTYAGTPVNFGEYDAQYSEEPRLIQINNTPNMDSETLEECFDICSLLYSRFGIETLLILWGEDDTEYDQEFVNVRKVNNGEEYRNALSTADIALSATIDNVSGYRQLELMASGQVLVGLSKPWTEEYIPDHSFTAGSTDDLKKMAFWVAKNWDEAVQKNKATVENLKERAGHEVIGKRLLDDMYEHVEETADEYSLSWDEEVIQDSINHLGGAPFTLKELDETTAEYTDSGTKLAALFGYTLVDLVNALRAMGYEDVGGRVPTFEEAT